MFYSHKKAGQAGPMTRILCCTKEEYDKLSDLEKNIVPTHWAPSYTIHPRTGGWVGAGEPGLRESGRRQGACSWRWEAEGG